MAYDINSVNDIKEGKMNLSTTDKAGLPAPKQKDVLQEVEWAPLEKASVRGILCIYKHIKKI